MYQNNLYFSVSGNSLQAVKIEEMEYYQIIH